MAMSLADGMLWSKDPDGSRRDLGVAVKSVRRRACILFYGKKGSKAVSISPASTQYNMSS